LQQKSGKKNDAFKIFQINCIHFLNSEEKYILKNPCSVENIVQGYFFEKN